MRYLLILGSFLCSTLMAAELYRWQDEQGQWHFGDAASTIGKRSQRIELAEQTQNIVTIKKVKLPKNKILNNKLIKVRTKRVESLDEKKIRCEKKRDELRFQPFRNEERNQYDRECVSEMKW